MKKLKLNIQYFGSTNKTQYYNLSQYIATDKPTYLIDYNADMLAIDTAIHNAMSKATNNETAIGTLSNLTTDSKSDLVSAINEVDSHSDTNANNITQNTTDIASNTGAIGNLINLNTTAKNNLVSAINELKDVNDTQNTNIAENTANIEKFNLNTFKSYNNNDSDFNTNVDIVDVNVARCNINIARNSDGSIFKIYGLLRFTAVQSTGYIRLKNTGINPTEAFNVYGAINTANTDSNWNNPNNVGIETMYVNADGSIDLKVVAPAGTNRQFTLPPCIYFAKSFGDIPVTI